MPKVDSSLRPSFYVTYEPRQAIEESLAAASIFEEPLAEMTSEGRHDEADFDEAASPIQAAVASLPDAPTPNGGQKESSAGDEALGFFQEDYSSLVRNIHFCFIQTIKGTHPTFLPLDRLCWTWL